MNIRTRITELDIVRAFAIIGVLLVHSSSFATSEMIYASKISFFIYNFINIFMKFGTPVFIFLSSFVLFFNYYNTALTRERLVSFYKKRFLYIIVPYAIFSTFYYFAVAITRPEPVAFSHLMLDFLVKLFTGTAYAHLYFIFISIQFYVLFPFILILLQKKTYLKPWIIPTGLIIQWCFYAAVELFEIPHASSWSFSYISFYMLGAFIGIMYKELRELVVVKSHIMLTVILWGSWLSIGLVHVYIWYILRLHNTLSPSLIFHLLWSLYTFLSAITLTQASVYIQKKFGHLKKTHTLKNLGTYSFGIYLLHPLILAVYREFRPINTNEFFMHIWYIGGFLLALFITWWVVAFAQKNIPFAWLLFGKNEKRQITLATHKNTTEL